MSNRERLEKLEKLSELTSWRQEMEHDYENGYRVGSGNEETDEEAIDGVYESEQTINEWLLEDALKRLPRVAEALKKAQESLDRLAARRGNNPPIFAEEEFEGTIIYIKNALMEEHFEPIFLTVPQIVERTGFNRSYIYNEIATGRLQAETFADGNKHVSALVFHRWLANPNRGKRSKVAAD